MSADGAASLSWRQRLLAVAERRLPALTRLRAAESLPVILHRRRIYVLPTGFGIVFGILLVVMQLGALNYSNNPALLLTCLLAGAAWMSMFSGFRTLAGLELIGMNAADCHAGDAVAVHLLFAESRRARPALQVDWNGVHRAFAIHSGPSQGLTIPLPTRQRGWLRPGRLKLWTEQPLGLFVIWSWVNPDVSILVYPEVESNAPPLPKGTSNQGDRSTPGEGDDYSGLRDYRSGDPQRRIAWKASARHDTLLVRESESQVDDNVTLDYAALEGLDRESRIRRLTAWVLAADAAMISYALCVPGQVIGPGIGSRHRQRCLRMLALLPDAPQ
ncbi:DUF58 domain-containing protein [Dokdonella sp.]|uniref:DUF58 domain-containing protein n=1 Tax=Dokdonella sp. TaxID=2291710 RepID=UPI0035298AA4